MVADTELITEEMVISNIIHLEGIMEKLIIKDLLRKMGQSVLIWMEVKKMIKDRKKLKQMIENVLAQEKKYEIINGRMCFGTLLGGYIRLDTIGGDYNCIVIEFAENKRDARNNRFEDGDLLYVDEMTVDEMTETIKKQIEE